MLKYSDKSMLRYDDEEMLRLVDSGIFRYDGRDERVQKHLEKELDDTWITEQLNRTSIGYHTFTISLPITTIQTKQLMKDFRDYRDKTGAIRIRPIETTEYDFIACKDITRIYKCAIEYPRNQFGSTSESTSDPMAKSLSDPTAKSLPDPNDTKDTRGIRWMLRPYCGGQYELKKFNDNPHMHRETYLREHHKTHVIEATINPKLLSGTRDYIRAADSSIMNSMLKAFNSEAAKISPVLKTFLDYNLNRVDYCINFDLNELGVGCSAPQTIALIKRADVPMHYTEWQQYDKTSHRMKSGEHSFYLKSKSVNINCYAKYNQLLNEYPDNPSLEDSRNIIRFEVQCKYRKTYTMKQLAKREARSTDDIVKHMLSDGISRKMIISYFHRIIKRGDYYTLTDARRLIEKSPCRANKKHRLVDVLLTVNKCRGIHKAKQAIADKLPDTGNPEVEVNTNQDSKTKLLEFNRSLNDLSELGINPVTIPREWGIRHIPNLLDTFFKQHNIELDEKDMEHIETNVDEILKATENEPTDFFLR